MNALMVFHQIHIAREKCVLRENEYEYEYDYESANANVSMSVSVLLS